MTVAHDLPIPSIEGWKNLPVFLVPASGLQVTVRRAAILVAEIADLLAARVRDYVELGDGIHGILGMISIDTASGPVLKRLPRAISGWAAECCAEAQRHEPPFPARVHFRAAPAGIEVRIMDGAISMITPAKSLIVYIDESGNSGDAAHHRNLFTEQPTFALVGIGEADESQALSSIIDELRARHRLKAGEIKGRSMKRHPKLEIDLLNAVVERGLPLFVELMDKAFFVANNIVTYALLGPSFLLSCPGAKELANSFADIVTEQIGSNGIEPYCDLATNPSRATFERFRGAFHQELVRAQARSNSGKLGDLLKMMSAAFECSMASCTAPRDDGLPGYVGLLPPPDYSGRGKRIAMLPYVPAFAHLYARVNHFAPEPVSVRAIHDEQQHFASILKNCAATLETSAHAHELRELQTTATAEWRFDPGKCKLEFANSKLSPGVQAADILARVFARRLNAVIAGSATSNDNFLSSLNRALDPSRGLGVNIVSTHRRCWRFWSEG